MKWLPIESAPRDGTPILVTNGSQIWLSYWCECDVWNENGDSFLLGKGCGGYESRMDWFGHDDDGVTRPIFDSVSRWMMLPKLPKVAGGDG